MNKTPDSAPVGSDDLVLPIEWVARECDLNKILKPAKAAYDAAIIEATNAFLK